MRDPIKKKQCTKCKTHMTEDEYLEYIKNAQNSTIKKKSSWKIGRRHSTKQDIQMTST